MVGPGLEEAGPAAAQRQAAVLRPELEQGRSWGSVDGACPLMMGHREGPAAPHGAQLRRQAGARTHRPPFLRTPPWVRLKDSATAGRGGPTKIHLLLVTAPGGHRRAGEAGARVTGSGKGGHLPLLPKLKGATATPQRQPGTSCGGHAALTWAGA